MYIVTLHNDEHPESVGDLGRHYSRRQVETIITGFMNSVTSSLADFYIIVTLDDDVLLDTREGNMFRKRTDKEWAFLYGLSVEQFLGIERITAPDVSHLPCGQDDAVLDAFEASQRIIRIRKEWGDDPDRCDDFGDYVRQYWID